MVEQKLTAMKAKIAIWDALPLDWFCILVPPPVEDFLNTIDRMLAADYVSAGSRGRATECMAAVRLFSEAVAVTVLGIDSRHAMSRVGHLTEVRPHASHSKRCFKLANGTVEVDRVGSINRHINFAA